MDGLTAAVAELVSTGAKAIVAVETGRLRKAIHVERKGRGNYSVVAGGPGVFYGHIVEHGGVHHAAQPFLVPSAEAVRMEVPAIGHKFLGHL